MNAKTKRVNPSKRVRFEVFKRDKFTCQYCGQKAPDVVLNVDHIEPHSKGGKSDVLNYATSCEACNSGKSNRRLGDDSVVKLARDQMELVQERREQRKMMLQWREELSSSADEACGVAAARWQKLSGFGLNENGLRGVRKILRSFSLDELLEAMDIASEQYLSFEGDAAHCTTDSFELGFRRLNGICYGRKLERDNPAEAQLRYARNILGRRWPSLVWRLDINELREYVAMYGEAEDLVNLAKTCRTFTAFEEFLKPTKG